MCSQSSISRFCFEFIIINDGSTDKSPEILSDIPEKILDKIYNKHHQKTLKMRLTWKYNAEIMNKFEVCQF